MGSGVTPSGALIEAADALSQKFPAPSQNRRAGREALSGVAFCRHWVWGCRSQEGSLHPESVELAPVVGAGIIQQG
jgi:hypothetical protein